MTKEKQPRPEWLGRPVYADSDATDLERSAAKYEFMQGLPRTEAEGQAYHEWKQKHHSKAAAYHLTMMKKTRHSGSHEASKQHAAMYSEHIKALGHHPTDGVPNEVQQHLSEPENGEGVEFKPHKADEFLVHEEPKEKKEEVKKAEDLLHELYKSLTETLEKAESRQEAPKDGETCPNCQGTHPNHWTACKYAVKGKTLHDHLEAEKKSGLKKEEIEKGVNGIRDPPSTQPGLLQQKTKDIK